MKCSTCKYDKSQNEFGKSAHRCLSCERLREKQRNLCPERCFEKYRYSAQKRKISFHISFEDFKTFWQKNCFYCSEKIVSIGIDRLDNTQGYVLSNLVPACKECNKAKRNLSIEQIKRIVIIAKRFK